MKKYLKDFTVAELQLISDSYGLIGFTPADGSDLPAMSPGQFVEISVPKSSGALLRRPISIHDVDETGNILWLLVRRAGRGTSALLSCHVGQTLSLLLPLGNGFTLPQPSRHVLLVGGGVGVAPLLYFGRKIKDCGGHPSFLLGARTDKDLLCLDKFKAVGDVYVTTEDGSMGQRGFVTDHSCLQASWDSISCCGPMPMMKSVAAYAKNAGIDCEVSLENMMACGLGACLCCVEDTIKGHVCVCSDGPVFNITQLKW